MPEWFLTAHGWIAFLAHLKRKSYTTVNIFCGCLDVYHFVLCWGCLRCSGSLPEWVHCHFIDRFIICYIHLRQDRVSIVINSLLNSWNSFNIIIVIWHKLTQIVIFIKYLRPGWSSWLNQHVKMAPPALNILSGTSQAFSYVVTWGTYVSK